MLYFSFNNQKYFENQASNLKLIFEQLMKDRQLGEVSNYIKSPYFNKDGAVIFVFERMIKTIKQGGYRINVKTLEKRFADGNLLLDLEKALIQLTKLMERFFIHDEIKNNVNNPTQEYLKALKKQANTQLFRQASDTYIAYHKNLPATIMSLNALWWVNHQNYFHQGIRKPDVSIRYLEDAIRFSRLAFILSQLRYQCESINLNQVLTEKVTMPGFEFLPHTISKETDWPPVIHAYVKVIALLKNSSVTLVNQSPDFHPYLDFHDYLKNHFPFFAKADQLVLIKQFINILTPVYEKGNGIALMYQFIWMKVALRENIYTFENKMSDGEYLNIVSVHGTILQYIARLLHKGNSKTIEEENFLNSLLGEYHFWGFVKGSTTLQQLPELLTQQKMELAIFVDDYAQLLEPNVSENALKMAHAYMLFYNGELRATLKYIKAEISVSDSDIKYGIRVKSILIRVSLLIFLQDDIKDDNIHEDFEKECENLRKYIERKDMPFSMKEGYKIFLKLAKQIYIYIHKGAYDSDRASYKSSIIENLNQAKSIVARPWFREVIQQLK